MCCLQYVIMLKMGIWKIEKSLITLCGWYKLGILRQKSVSNCVCSALKDSTLLKDDILVLSPILAKGNLIYKVISMCA